jgi:hypothetical protein
LSIRDASFRSTTSPTAAASIQCATKLQQPSRHGPGAVGIDVWPASCLRFFARTV